jgi:hypothetical protein
MHYKVGQLVVNRKLGIGKILEVSRDTVLVYFRNEAVNPRTINIAAAAMELAADQADPAFSDDDNIERMKRPTKKGATKAKRISRRSTHVPAKEETETSVEAEASAE